MIAPAQSDVPKLALTAAECAESLGVSERHLQQLALDGKVPSLLLGNRRVFPVNVLQAWMLREGSRWLISESAGGGEQ